MKTKRVCLVVMVALGIISASQALASSGYWDWDFGVFGYGGKIGVTSVTTDGYDGELPITYGGVPTTYAAIYHEEGVNGWDGPNGFYTTDWAALLTPGQTKTWQIYVWSTLDVPADYSTSGLAFGSSGIVPIEDYRFQFTLKSKPSSITDGPEVGTTWRLYGIGGGTEFGVLFPTYRTDNGLTGYHFEFSATVVPEPSAFAALACGLVGILTQARKRRSQ